MGDHEAEQYEEIEVLSSIFPDEFELVSNNPNNFKILLKPNQDDEENFVMVSLEVEFPVEYPEVVPNLKIEVKKGLGKKQADELKTLADNIALENIGMPCIFSVAEGVKEWLVDNNVAGQDGSMYAEMMRKMQMKDVEAKKSTEKAAIIAAADSELKSSRAMDPEEEERLRRRQAGTQVTLETFMGWKESFDAEMAILNNAKEVVKDERPTGKELFLRNSAGREGSAGSGDVPLTEEEIEALIAQGISEEFGDMDFADLEREEDDEDDEDFVLGEGDEDDEDEDDDDYEEEES